MRSVADDLRVQTVARVLELTPRGRVELALRLGDADVQLFASARKLSPADARRQLAVSRQRGRSPSRSACR